MTVITKQGWKRMENEQSYRPDIAYGPPPPAVVLGGELEVGERHPDRPADQKEQEEGQQQDAVQEVLLPTPDRLERVVQLHRDGAERDEATHNHLQNRGNRGNRHLVIDTLFG